MKINKELAKKLLEEEIQHSINSECQWIENIKKLSDLCEDGHPRTHIAFIGAACLAKALELKVDLYAIKPTLDKGNKNAMSIRTLCHDVLVPFAMENDIDLGVYGREPLNNQPYFRMTSLGDNTPIHYKSKQSFDYVLLLVSQLTKINSKEEAKKALCAFLKVRKKTIPQYSYNDVEDISLLKLKTSVQLLLASGSFHGKIAQAITAGFFDVFAGFDRVISGKIHDPSRNYPGDICIVDNLKREEIVKSIEVRDKKVTLTDILIFAEKCRKLKITDCAVVMTAKNQSRFDSEWILEWCQKTNITITLFYGIDSVIDQTLFWNPRPSLKAIEICVNRIQERLIEIEAPAKMIELWSEQFKRIA